MGFASEYLSNRVLFDPFIKPDPDGDTAIIVIIPAFNEPDIGRTIDSLARCHKPECSVELIVHINAGSGSTNDQVESNREIANNIEIRGRDTKLPFRLFAFNTGVNTIKGWGAGLARKVVMDEAVRRFSVLNRPGGIIVSLDADCEVSENYLQNIYRDFYSEPGRKACSIYFEHPLQGEIYDESVYRAITNYELHLRYYYQALMYAGIPEVYHTVGSAFAVRAGIYVMAGGMNRHQAGEDFYFIQKTIPMGGYFYLTSVSVKPSPRISERVPFGTGPAIRDILSRKDSGLQTYNPDAFTSVRIFLLNVSKLYNIRQDDFDSVGKLLSINTLGFLEREKWKEKILEINSNTASPEAFNKRFFSWFNMFKMVKYLNWSHSEGYYEKPEVSKAASELLRLLGMETETVDVESILLFYRGLER